MRDGAVLLLCLVDKSNGMVVVVATVRVEVQTPRGDGEEELAVQVEENTAGGGGVEGQALDPMPLVVMR